MNLKTLITALVAALVSLPAAADLGLYNRSSGGGGGGADLSSAICTPPLACAAGTWTWAGATLTGTPAAGDVSYWTGSSTEALVTNASGAAGKTLQWTSGAAPTWGGPALNFVGAANAAGTLANGNSLQTWQWAKTSDSSGGLRITESAASTGGTSTSNIPNQYLLKLDTLAASTASPLTVYQRGAHVFSVDPTNPQIWLGAGSLTNPTLAFSSNTGLYYTSSVLNFAVGGTRYAFDSGVWYGPTGTGTSPGITDLTNQNSGLFIGNALSGISISSTENTKWTAGIAQYSKGTADAVSYAINARKSRGTVASPTVITTGDALLTMSGYGYVGGTNTYREATRIEFDSTGTIADATTGVGGVIKLMTTKAGTDSAVQTNLTLSGGSTPDTKVAGTFSLTSVLVNSTTAPTLASGGCTSPTAVTTLNGTALFNIGVGSSCSGSQPLVFTLPAATTGWYCTARNVTNGATSSPAQTGAVSTTSVTITNFVRTTGVAGAWTNSDVVWVSCVGG